MAMDNLSKEKFEELGAYIDSLPSKKGELIRVLHRAQSILGISQKRYSFLWQEGWMSQRLKFTEW